MKNYKENAHIKSQSKRMENGSEKVVGKKLISYLNIAICTQKPIGKNHWHIAYCDFSVDL